MLTRYQTPDKIKYEERKRETSRKAFRKLEEETDKQTERRPKKERRKREKRRVRKKRKREREAAASVVISLAGRLSRFVLVLSYLQRIYLLLYQLSAGYLYFQRIAGCV